MLRLLLVPLLVAAGIAVVPATVADAAPTVAAGSSVSARTVLNHLRVATEKHAKTYKPSRFGSWIDADGDGENTRTEVLKAESEIDVIDHDNGTPWMGLWESRYDDRLLTDAAKTRIDHLVPLKEAWTSGAATWSAKKRQAYANDLGFGPSLAVVSAKAERTKGDREPSAYLPSNTTYRCTYVKNWIAVKWRWHLTVDRAEQRFLGGALEQYCSSTRMKRPLKPSISRLVAHAAAPASHETGESAGDDASVSEPESTDPGADEPTVVDTAPVAVGVVYANCDAVRAAGAAPLYSFEAGYRPALDRDGDGIACEDADGTSTSIWTPTPVTTSPIGGGAICRDGTVSHSAHRSGTCSHHGGVASWG